MSTMKTTPDVGGLMRCSCGTLFRPSVTGRCTACGATVESILAKRKRFCALKSCGKEFMPEHSQQRTCCARHGNLYNRQEQNRRRADKFGYAPSAPRDDENAHVVEEGPDTPLYSPRRCHDCGEATTDYRCAPCRAKWRAKHGADGLNGLAELFTAGHCFADVLL